MERFPLASFAGMIAGRPLPRSMAGPRDRRLLGMELAFLSPQREKPIEKSLTIWVSIPIIQLECKQDFSL
jgi:hypothetical protein